MNKRRKNPRNYGNYTRASSDHRELLRNEGVFPFYTPQCFNHATEDEALAYLADILVKAYLEQRNTYEPTKLAK